MGFQVTFADIRNDEVETNLKKYECWKFTQNNIHEFRGQLAKLYCNMSHVAISNDTMEENESALEPSRDLSKENRSEHNGAKNVAISVRILLKFFFLSINCYLSHLRVYFYLINLCFFVSILFFRSVYQTLEIIVSRIVFCSL